MRGETPAQGEGSFPPPPADPFPGVSLIDLQNFGAAAQGKPKMLALHHYGRIAPEHMILYWANRNPTEFWAAVEKHCTLREAPDGTMEKYVPVESE